MQGKISKPFIYLNTDQICIVLTDNSCYPVQRERLFKAVKCNLMQYARAIFYNKSCHRLKCFQEAVFVLDRLLLVFMHPYVICTPCLCFCYYVAYTVLRLCHYVSLSLVQFMTLCLIFLQKFTQDLKFLMAFP